MEIEGIRLEYLRRLRDLRSEVRNLKENLSGGRGAVEQTVEPLCSQFVLLAAALPAGERLATANRLKQNIQRLITDFEKEAYQSQYQRDLLFWINETMAPIMEAAGEVINLAAAEAADDPAALAAPAVVEVAPAAVEAAPAVVEAAGEVMNPAAAQPVQPAQAAQAKEPADRGKRSLQDISGDPKRRRMDSISSSGDKDDQKAQGLVSRIELYGNRVSENMEKLIAKKRNDEQEESVQESSVVEAKDNFLICLEVLIAVSNELQQREAVMDQILKIKEIGQILNMMETLYDHAGGYKGEAKALIEKYGQDIQWIEELNINLKRTAYMIGGNLRNIL